MLKTILLLLLISNLWIYGQEKSYITVSKGKIVIGNKNIERVIDIKDGTASTTEILNKRSGSNYEINSDEFALNIIFSSWGPAYSKKQNGESNVLLTSKDFQYKNYSIRDLEDSGKEINLNYTFNQSMTAFVVNVFYQIYPGDIYMRKWIEISDTSFGTQFLDRIYLESLTFKEKEFSHGSFGQPVFNKDIFLGVEYPTTENIINSEKVLAGYIVGQKITNNVYKSHTSILGTAPSSVKLEQTFMSYVDDIKVKGTRQFLLYNTWYDMRLPFLIDNPNNILNEKNVLNRIDSFKRTLSSSNIQLNAFVIDLGWDKITPEWEIDSAKFPNGFSLIKKSLDSIHTSLGLWASPWGGYEERNQRVKWANQHGYETSGDFLCFAGKKYFNALFDAMVNYTNKYDIGYFKWDGLSIGCNELNHGHLPGIYSHEAIVSNFISMIDSVRKINPDIFINITIGTWLSPWWLKYADCVWMQGEDYGYADNVPCINDRDKAITYKDGVLWDDLRNQQLLFPISSIMTHGIIKGSLNLLGGKNETLDSFSNEVMMYFGRGVSMWELYLTPDLVSGDEWKSITSTIKWAKANKDVLKNTRMILGNPLKKEPYGFIHLTKDKGILLLRNPDVTRHEVKVKLTPDFGDISTSSKYFIKVIYPYNMILPDPVGINQEFVLNLDGYEILTAELIPLDNINKDFPVGIKYSIDDNKLTVYGESASPLKVKSIDNRELTEINKKREKINIKAFKSIINEKDEFISSCEIKIPKTYKNSKIGFLLECPDSLQGIPEPAVKIVVNNENKKINIKQQNGKWFWIFADLDPSSNDVSCKINLDKKEKWTVDGWLFADEELSGKTVLLNNIKGNEEIIPARPYSANIYKVIMPLR